VCDEEVVKREKERGERERERERRVGWRTSKRRWRRVDGERGVGEGEIRQTFGERDGRGAGVGAVAGAE